MPTISLHIKNAKRKPSMIKYKIFKKCAIQVVQCTNNYFKIDEGAKQIIFENFYPTLNATV